jgi:hypothetical protein
VCYFRTFFSRYAIRFVCVHVISLFLLSIVCVVWLRIRVPI